MRSLNAGVVDPNYDLPFTIRSLIFIESSMSLFVGLIGIFRFAARKLLSLRNGIIVSVIHAIITFSDSAEFLLKLKSQGIPSNCP